MSVFAKILIKKKIWYLSAIEIIDTQVARRGRQYHRNPPPYKNRPTKKNRIYKIKNPPHHPQPDPTQHHHQPHPTPTPPPRPTQPNTTTAPTPTQPTQRHRPTQTQPNPTQREKKNLVRLDVVV